jgi:hypothetical protein
MTKALQSPPAYAALFKGNRGARPPAQMRAALAVKWEPGLASLTSEPEPLSDCLSGSLVVPPVAPIIVAGGAMQRRRSCR